MSRGASFHREPRLPASHRLSRSLAGNALTGATLACPREVTQNTFGERQQSTHELSELWKLVVRPREFRSGVHVCRRRCRRWLRTACTGVVLASLLLR